MTGNIALDIFIGLVFVYLLYSLLASVLLEIISTHFRIRANNLRHVIYTMLNDDAKKTPGKFISWLMSFLGKGRSQERGGLARAVYHSPLIQFMGSKDGKRKGPSYISPQQFADALLQHMTKESVTNVRATNVADDQVQRVRSFLETTPSNSLTSRQVDEHPSPVEASESGIEHLQFLFRDAGEDLEKFKAKIADWYEEMMSVATEWYKRNMQVWLFIIGFFIAVVFDANTFYMVKVLSLDNEARTQLVQLSGEFLEANETLESYQKKENIETARRIFGDVQNHAQSAMAVFGITRPLPDNIVVDRNNVSEEKFENLKNEVTSYTKDQNGRYVIFKQPKELRFINVGEYVYVDCMKDGRVPFNKLHFFLCYSLLGYLLTALAVSLGAPFWFDLLNKLMRLKGAVAPKAAESKQNDNKTSGK